MPVRFQIDVEGSAVRFLPGGFKGKNLSVLHTGVGIGSGSHDVVLRIGNHRAYIGIRRGQSESLARKIKRATKKLFLGLVQRHSGNLPCANRLSSEGRVPFGDDVFGFLLEKGMIRSCLNERSPDPTGPEMRK
jgi:hypothetical protein